MNTTAYGPSKAAHGLAGIQHATPAPIPDLAEIPSLLHEHREVNTNLHNFLDDLEKKLIPVMDNRPEPVISGAQTSGRDYNCPMACEMRDSINSTRLAQERIAAMARRLCLSVALVFVLPCCTTNETTGNREFLGLSSGQWLTAGIGFGKKSAPIARDEYLAAREVTASK